MSSIEARNILRSYIQDGVTYECRYKQYFEQVHGDEGHRHTTEWAPRGMGMDMRYYRDGVPVEETDIPESVVDELMKAGE